MMTQDVNPEEPVVEPGAGTEPVVPLSVPELPLAAETALPTGDISDNDRLMAGLAYASQVLVPIVVPAIMLLAEESKKRSFQKYHGIQSLAFFVAVVVYEVLATIVFVGLTIVSLGCLSCVLWLLFLLPVGPAFYYAYQAYQGRYFDIPWLTQFLVDNKWLERPAV